MRAYAQRDPLREYQTDAFEMFEAFLTRLGETITRTLSLVEFRSVSQEQLAQMEAERMARAQESRRDPALAQVAGAEGLQATGTDGMARPAPGPGGPHLAKGPAPVSPIRRAPPPGIDRNPRRAPHRPPRHHPPVRCRWGQDEGLTRNRPQAI